jgi:hypothetical protein
MAAVGSKLVVTSQGFVGSFGAWFGFFDLSNPTSPVWGAGNCTGPGFAGFTVPPSGVAQLSGRAYFLYNLPAQPAVIFSNVNNALANGDTPVTPILTFGDNARLTAIAGLPLENQLGGIIQSLMVFKDASNIYQITGDAANSNLSINSLNVPTGTTGPATVVPTPKGLGFISPDGLRVIDWDARVSDPIGVDGQGVTLPFIYAVAPSRMTATCNGQIYRVTVQNGLVPGTSVSLTATAATPAGSNQLQLSSVAGLQTGFPVIDTSNPTVIPGGTVIAQIVVSTNTVTLSANIVAPGISNGHQIVCVTSQGIQEWWYDFSRRIWTGPHSSGMSSISPYSTTFIGALRGVPGALWRSDYLQSNQSTFVENGQQLVVNHQTVLLPDTEQMTNNNMTQTTLDVAFASGSPPLTINAVDQNAQVMTSAQILPPGGAPLWGQVNWGQFNWGGVQTALSPHIVPWPIPVDFTRMSLQATVPATQALRIGTWHMRYKVLRFLVDINSSLPVTAQGPLFILDQSQLGGPNVLG